jgi:hypothetical protein
MIREYTLNTTTNEHPFLAGETLADYALRIANLRPINPDATIQVIAASILVGSADVTSMGDTVRQRALLQDTVEIRVVEDLKP